MNLRLFQTNEVLKYLQPDPVIANPTSRLGSNNDGGYVVVNDFSKNDFLISMGVADDINFEADISPLIAGIDLYDDSIQSLPGKISNGKFFKERIGKFPNISIADAILRTEHTQDLILKMDIEGFEFRVVEAMYGSFLKEGGKHLPLQIAFEQHFITGSPSQLSWSGKNPGLGAGDMAILWIDLTEMGYVLTGRNDNPGCPSCSELSAIRVFCD